MEGGRGGRWKDDWKRLQPPKKSLQLCAAEFSCCHRRGNRHSGTSRLCFSFAQTVVLLPFFLLAERHYWDSKLRIPTADFDKVLHDDKAALDWLLALRRVGMVHMKGAPVEKGQVVRLAQRIGYLRLTFYG